MGEDVKDTFTLSEAITYLDKYFQSIESTAAYKEVKLALVKRLLVEELSTDDWVHKAFPKLMDRLIYTINNYISD